LVRVRIPRFSLSDDRFQAADSAKYLIASTRRFDLPPGRPATFAADLAVTNLGGVPGPRHLHPRTGPHRVRDLDDAADPGRSQPLAEGQAMSARWRRFRVRGSTHEPPRAPGRDNDGSAAGTGDAHGNAHHAALERCTARARTSSTAIAVPVGLLSLAGPLSVIASTTVANGVPLAAMHLAVAAVLIPGLAGTAPSLARPAPARQQ
jgi:hypothetical protein